MEDHVGTVRTMLFGLLLAAPLLAHSPHKPSHVRDRVVWERGQYLPANQFERVGIRVVCKTRDGLPLTTEVTQIAEMYHGHLSSLVVELPGVELTGATFCDMNADGVAEVLLRFAPPMQQERSRLVLLSYSRRDRHYVRVWDLPGNNLKARWVQLSHERDGTEFWGLEVKSLDATGLPVTRRYGYNAERVRPL
jgi:hypothetical protein